VRLIGALNCTATFLDIKESQMTDESQQLPAVPKPQLHGGGAVVALVPQTLEEAYRLADAMSRSGLTPSNIKTPESVLVALMAGAELGFPPFQSLQSFAVINGRPSIYGDAVPALLWSKGFDIEEAFDGEDPTYPDTMKAVCTVTRPGGKKVTRTFSVADAKEGQLWTKGGPWTTAKKRMLQMRARGYAARDGASDVMRGLPLYEEAQDFEPIHGEDLKAGTGMVVRLKARQAEVDPAGFNARGIAAETTAARPAERERALAEGHAAPDEIYLMHGVGQDETGRWPTWQNGAKFSITGRRPASMKTYAAHPPGTVLGAAEAAAAALGDDDLPEGLRAGPGAVQDAQFEDAGEVADESDEGERAPSAEPDNPTSGSVTDASTGSAAEKSGQTESSARSEPETKADLLDFPGDRGRSAPSETAGADSADLGGSADQNPSAEGNDGGREMVQQEDVPQYDVEAMNAYAKAVKAAPDLLALEKLVADLRVSDNFKAAPKDHAAKALGLAYGRGEALNDELFADDKVRPEVHAWFFRLWLAQAPPHEVKSTFRVLMRAKSYTGLSQQEQDVILDETDAAAGT
jgi:hypothetical protein